MLRQPLSLYIHWPFCKAKCPYCDFNSHVRDAVDGTAWEEALLKELAYFAEKLPGRRLKSIFFGGGTPTLMPPRIAERLITAAREHWDAAPDLEITLEGNPTSVEAAALAAFRDAGVNRVSLGVQALNAADLKFLGRQHSPAEALRAVEIAAKLFDRYSFDLIYARPGQTLAAWEAELREALKYAGGHLSLYQLTIEPGTAFFHAHARGEFQLPDEDVAAEMFEITQEIMDSHGLPMYEVSNHAAPGQESRHNLTYWTGGEYAGVGPGAHSRCQVSGVRCQQRGGGNQENAIENYFLPETWRLTPDTWSALHTLKSPERWLSAVETQGHGVEAQETLEPSTVREEQIMMGLRLREGIDKERFYGQHGVTLESALNARARATLTGAGLLEETPTHLRARPAGMLLLNKILADLLG